MNSNTKIELPKFILYIPLILGIGIALAGYYISNTLVKYKSKGGYVTVKGLAEREVLADFVIWPITIREAGANLIESNKKMEANIQLVKNFLLEQGIKSEEIDIGNYKVNDMLANNYRPEGEVNLRYTIQATLIIRTANIDAIKKASNTQYLLAQNGIVFGAKNDYEDSGPLYEFNKFNEIKSEILSEAIKNARHAAEQFAKDANCKIGELKKANQGSFTILPADGTIISNENTDIEKRSIRKKIRAVSTLEYELK